MRILAVAQIAELFRRDDQTRRRQRRWPDEADKLPVLCLHVPEGRRDGRVVRARVRKGTLGERKSKRRRWTVLAIQFRNWRRMPS